MQLLDPAHPFFAPLWRRVVIVALTLLWAVFEFATGAPFWGILFAAIGAYAGYHFFLASPGSPPDDRQDP